MMLMLAENIQAAKAYSEEMLSKLRNAVGQLSLPKGALVIVVGSLARREASRQSDIDYFVVLEEESAEQSVVDDVGRVVNELGLSAPSPTGAFAKIITYKSFLEKIGGNNESNDDLTRRMLFLLES